VRVTDVSGKYKDAYFTINVNPTITVSPSTGTTSPATKFNLTVGGLTPMAQYRLQVWDGGGTQRWSQYYNAAYDGGGASVHQWWWTTGETPGTYRARVTDITGKYKETTFTITQPVGNLSVSFTENPFTCDGGLRTFGTISGATPGETITFTSSPPLTLASGAANSSGQLAIKWQCTPAEVQTWSVTARGASSGRTVTFSVVGKAPVATVNPTVSVSPSSGTTAPATVFTITIGGLTPSGTYRLQIWDGGNVRRWDKNYVATSTGAGSRNHQWYWESPETPGTYRVRVTDLASTKYKETTFVITKTTVNTKPLVIFVQGMNTSADGSSASPGEWQGLRALLGTGYDYAMFSYADDYADSARTLPRYDTDDTCGSIDTESSPGLSQRFLTWYDQVSTGRIAVHVVTHSMGGVVVVYALTIRTPTNLRSVTTLDSPLAGSLPAAIADLFPAVGCGWWADRYDDLVSDSVVIRTIQTLRVSSTIARLLTTVGNKLDLVVRNGISHTGSEWLSTAISTACDGDAWNHACVFDSAIARQALINNVRKGAGLPSVFSCDGLTATLAGTSGWDRIRGTRGADIIYGGARGDVLYGYNGDDRLCGGTGNDSFYGGEGTDRCDIVALEANTSCEVKSS
jgi:pimeloyl-ACP methyl ester carboxylesterase